MGVYLSNPDTKKTSDDCSNKKGVYGTSCMQGWRMNMEDAHIFECDFEADASLFAIFDGHGGEEVAKFVEHKFGAELKRSEHYATGNYPEALRRTFLRMDEVLSTSEGQKELLKYKEKGGEESCAGCTAHVIFIKDKKMYIANSGDSRSILYKNNKVVKLSEDHKPDNEIERQRITNAGGFIINGRVNGNLNLSRALGDLEYKKNPKLRPEEQLISAMPDVREHLLEADDEFVVMGCDGVWEILSDEEICRFVQERLAVESKVSKVCEDLLDKCLAPDTTQGVGCDNMSAIILKFKN